MRIVSIIPSILVLASEFCHDIEMGVFEIVNNIEIEPALACGTKRRQEFDLREKFQKKQEFILIGKIDQLNTVIGRDVIWSFFVQNQEKNWYLQKLLPV